MATILRKNKLNDLIATLQSHEIAVFGPVGKNDSDVSRFAQIETDDAMDLTMILPTMSVKDLFFPCTETLMTFDLGKQKVDVDINEPDSDKRVIFGVRPCDAASLPILDKLFNWDFQDLYWNRRRENTTIVSVACTESDAFCMCASLGYAPDSTDGVDMLLRELADGTGWRIEAITDKGKAIAETIAELCDETENADLKKLADVGSKFGIDKAADWLKRPENFESDLWKTISQRCIGCGACTYLCPTCHCFDIQDEGDVYHGCRRKNWDSCSFAQFTAHTSGHNPRPDQPSRWRQRIMHKYNYYPTKFSVVACTGCGRCTRHCPVDMGVTETLETIGK